MTSPRSLAMIAALSFGLLLPTVGVRADGPAPATTPNPAASQSKWELMAGTWTIATVGTLGKMGTPTKNLDGKIVLVFDEKDKPQIAGKPFGFDILRASLSSAKAGSDVHWRTTYTVKGYGQTVDIDWSGKLSDDGTKITDGHFNFMLGTGKFTAEKKVDPKAVKPAAAGAPGSIKLQPVGVIQSGGGAGGM